MTSRIDETELALYGTGNTVADRMAREIRDLRAARAASRQRVVAVVREVAVDVLALDHGVEDAQIDDIANRVADALAAPQPRRAPTLEETLDRHAGVMAGLAEVAAEQLAGQASHGALTDQERSQLVDLIHTEAAYDRPAAEQAILRVLAGQEVALSADERRLVQAIRSDLIGDVAITEWSRHVALLDRLLSAPGQVASPAAGQAVALSAADLRDAELREAFLAALEWQAGRLDLAEQLSSELAAAEYARGKVASPAAGDVAEPQPGTHRYDRDATSGIGHCKVCGSDDEHDGSHVVAEPQLGAREAAIRALQNGTTLSEVAAALLDAEAPPPSASLDAATCRRLASELRGDTPPSWWLRHNLPEVARQLTAAAEIAERTDEVRHKWAQAAESAMADRDAAIIERDAARAELAMEREQFVAQVLDHDKARDKFTAELVSLTAERDDARAECERLRGRPDGHRAGGELAEVTP